MNPSFSSLSCCCASNSVDLREILRRITPIDYFSGFLLENEPSCPSQKGTLLVDSNQFLYGQLAFPKCDGTGVGTAIDGSGISTDTVIAKQSIFVGQTQITSSGSVLQLPCGTTVCGVPIVGGASIQFFMLQVAPTNGQQSNLPITSAGDYIVGGFFQNGYLSFVQYVYYWPCLFSMAAKVNSISIYWNVATGAAGLPITANNIVAELRIRKQNGTIINTGQTVSYAPAVANNTSYFISVEGLSYNVEAGDRAGVYISWDGQLATDVNYHYSWITYNIGYTPSI
jgi:hypothetical protein